jgi:hypothetical protein
MTSRLPSQQRALSGVRGTGEPRPRIVSMRAIACTLLAFALAACSGGSPASPVAVNASSADADPPDAEAASDADPFAKCPSSEPTSGTIPADVDAVLKDRCQTCHTDPPQMNAPFPLLTFAQIHALFAGVIPTYQEMDLLIQPGADPHMPFGNAPQLSAAQFSTLDSWLKACAPSGT